MWQLKEKIHLKLKIQIDDQELFFPDGRQIFGFELDSTLLQVSLKHMSKVIVVIDFTIIVILRFTLRRHDFPD